MWVVRNAAIIVSVAWHRPRPRQCRQTVVSLLPIFSNNSNLQMGLKMEKVEGPMSHGDYITYLLVLL